MANTGLYQGVNSGSDYGALSLSSVGKFIDRAQNVFLNKFGGDWAPHHIIPKSLVAGTNVSGETKGLLQKLTMEGLFSGRDGTQNLAWLPKDQAIADRTGQALHSPGENHTAYTNKVDELIKKIREKNTLPDNLDADTPELRTKLQNAAADIAALQNVIAKNLTGQIPEDFTNGKAEVRHSQIKLNNAEARAIDPEKNFLNKSLDQIIRENQAIWDEGRVKFHSALAAGNPNALWEERNRTMKAAEDLARQIDEGKFVAQKGLDTVVKKLSKTLGIAGIGVAISNVVLGFYKEGGAGLLKAIKEEADGIALGLGISAVAVGITY